MHHKIEITLESQCFFSVFGGNFRKLVNLFFREGEKKKGNFCDFREFSPFFEIKIN